MLAITVFCVFLAVPGVAWALGFVTAYVALVIIAVGFLISVQAPIFLLFDALGWLPTSQRHERTKPDGINQADRSR
jgi:hypothetical protein